MQSRQVSDVSSSTLIFYRVKLNRFLNELDADTAKSQNIEKFLLQFHNPGKLHAYYRVIKTVDNVRDKAIIALFTESGFRLFELTNIKLQDINWEARAIRIIGKGRKEAFAPFDKLAEKYLREWSTQYTTSGNIRRLNQWGIISMLRRLEGSTGLP